MPAASSRCADQEGGRRLAVGAGDADHPQLAPSGRRGSAPPPGPSPRARRRRPPRARRAPSGRSHTSAAAPRSTASGAKSWPSAREAGHAEEERPGRDGGVEYARPVISTAGAPCPISSRRSIAGESTPRRAPPGARRERSLAAAIAGRAARTSRSSGTPGAATVAAVDRALRLVDHHRHQQPRVARRREADERRDVLVLRVAAVRGRASRRCRSCPPACSPGPRPPARCRPAPRTPSSIVRTLLGGRAARARAAPAAPVALRRRAGARSDAAVGDRRVGRGHLHRRDRDALADRQVADRRARVLVAASARCPRASPGRSTPVGCRSRSAAPSGRSARRPASGRS